MDLFIGTKQRDCDQSYIEYLENNEKVFFFFIPALQISTWLTVISDLTGFHRLQWISINSKRSLSRYRLQAYLIHLSYFNIFFAYFL